MEHKLDAVLHSFKKNQNSWLIASLIVVVISGAVATFVTAERVANLAAKSSIAETKSYLNKVTNAAQTSEAPKEIAAAVTAIEKPSFPEVSLGNVSESYRTARNFHNEIIEKVDTFVQRINSYAALQSFDEKYRSLTSELGQFGTSDIQGRYETLKDINKLIVDTKAPTDFTDKFTEVSRVYVSMERNSEGIVTAQKMGNNEAVEMLSGQYAMAAAQVPRVQTDVTTYVDQVAEKVERMVNELKRYEEGL